MHSLTCICKLTELVPPSCTQLLEGLKQPSLVIRRKGRPSNTKNAEEERRAKGFLEDLETQAAAQRVLHEATDGVVALRNPGGKGVPKSKLTCSACHQLGHRSNYCPNRGPGGRVVIPGLDDTGDVGGPVAAAVAAAVKAAKASLTGAPPAGPAPAGAPAAAADAGAPVRPLSAAVPFADGQELGEAWHGMIGTGDHELDESLVEQKLKENQQFLRRVVATTADGIFFGPAKELLLAVAKRLAAAGDGDAVQEMYNRGFNDGNGSSASVADISYIQSLAPSLTAAYTRGVLAGQKHKADLDAAAQPRPTAAGDVANAASSAAAANTSRGAGAPSKGKAARKSALVIPVAAPPPASARAAEGTVTATATATAAAAAKAAKAKAAKAATTAAAAMAAEAHAKKAATAVAKATAARAAKQKAETTKAAAAKAVAESMAVAARAEEALAAARTAEAEEKASSEEEVFAAVDAEAAALVEEAVDGGEFAAEVEAEVGAAAAVEAQASSGPSDDDAAHMRWLEQEAVVDTPSAESDTSEIVAQMDRSAGVPAARPTRRPKARASQSARRAAVVAPQRKKVPPVEEEAAGVEEGGAEAEVEVDVEAQEEVPPVEEAAAGAEEQVAEAEVEVEVEAQEEVPPGVEAAAGAEEQGGRPEVQAEAQAHQAQEGVGERPSMLGKRARQSDSLPVTRSLTLPVRPEVPKLPKDYTEEDFLLANQAIFGDELTAGGPCVMRYGETHPAEYRDAAAVLSAHCVKHWASGRLRLDNATYCTGFSEFDYVQGEHDPEMQAKDTAIFRTTRLGVGRKHLPGLATIERHILTWAEGLPQALGRKAVTAGIDGLRQRGYNSQGPRLRCNTTPTVTIALPPALTLSLASAITLA